MVSLGYSRAKQRLFCGDRRGDVLIFDLRQMSLLQSLTVHSSTVNRIVVDDINGFFATGSADGDIKVGVVGGCGLYTCEVCIVTVIIIIVLYYMSFCGPCRNVFTVY